MGWEKDANLAALQHLQFLVEDEVEGERLVEPGRIEAVDQRHWGLLFLLGLPL